MINRKFGILLVVVFLIPSASCTKDKTVLNPQIALNCSPNVSFLNDIGPIFQQNCTTTSCHDASAQGGLNFTTHGEIAEHAEHILMAIKHEPNVAPMPSQLPKLQDSLIQRFECWVLQGKQNN